jgi:hypothetical protein
MNIRLLLIALVFVYSCKNSSSKNKKIKQTKTTITKVEKKQNIEIEIPDIDSITDLRDLKHIYEGAIKNVNNSLDKLETKTIKITMNNIPNTPVTIWYNNKMPVKIEYGVADDFGEIIDVFAYYYKDNKVWLFDGIFSKYIYKNDKLRYWVNEKWKVVSNVSAKNFKEAEEISISHSKELITLFE